MKTSITTKKEFSYKEGDVNLNFSLMVDNEKNLKDFEKVLDQALKDVKELIPSSR
jgi:hypothetical protein